MYAGKVCESATTTALFQRPRHPYTNALMASLPAVATHGGDLYAIPGLPPDLTRAFAGCPFSPRCREAMDPCAKTPIRLAYVTPEHATSCLRVQAGEL